MLNIVAGIIILNVQLRLNAHINTKQPGQIRAARNCNFESCSEWSLNILFSFPDRVIHRAIFGVFFFLHVQPTEWSLNVNAVPPAIYITAQLPWHRTHKNQSINKWNWCQWKFCTNMSGKAWPVHLGRLISFGSHLIIMIMIMIFKKTFAWERSSSLFSGSVWCTLDDFIQEYDIMGKRFFFHQTDWNFFRLSRKVCLFGCLQPTPKGQKDLVIAWEIYLGERAPKCE